MPKINPPTPAAVDSWQSLWRSIQIATCADNITTPYGLINDGAIAIAGNRIAWVGREADLPPQLPPHVTIHSGNNCVVTPGLIDCHTHLIYGGNRANEFELRLKGASYQTITYQNITYQTIAQQGGGILATVAATRAASRAELLTSAQQRVNQLQSEGVTHLEIKSGYGLDLANERKLLSIARELSALCKIDVTTTFLGAHTVPPEFNNRADAYIDILCNDMLPTLANEGLIDCVDIFCEPIAFNLEQTARVFAAAQQLQLKIKAHAEQLSHSGATQLACQYQAISVDHLEYVNESDVRRMANANCAAVLLPVAFYFLRETQLPPIQLFRDYGVPVAVASDCNPGSAPSTSLLLAANMACVIFGLTPEEALLGMTRNAAKALGIAQQKGSIETGKIADFVLWDIHHPNQLAYQIGIKPLKLVKAGELVLT